MRSHIFLLFIFVSFASSAVVKWLPNKSFNIPINFKDGRLPCSKETVVFPQTAQESIVIDHDASVSGLILPRDGDIIIDGVISLGADVDDDCKEEGNVYYVPRSQSSWNEADVWSSEKFNEATPDAERLPCFDDEVQFPATSEFTVILPNGNQYVSALKLGSDSFDIQHFINYEMNQDSHQQFIANDYGGTGLIVKAQECHARSGCPCQAIALKIDCSTKFCPKPKCVDPIQPIGHCCEICGGFMTLKIDKSFDFMAFKEHIANIIESYGKDKFIYHIGRIPGDEVIQVVVLDKGEYTGNSAYIAHMIEVESENIGMNTLAIVSGSPLSKAGMGWKIFFSMFFVVTSVMGAIYFYYYKFSEMPEVRFPALNQRHRAVVSQLTRFNRRTDSVISLTRRDSGVTIAPETPNLGMAFRNPLYDSKRGRVQVVDPVPEEDNDSLKDKVY